MGLGHRTLTTAGLGLAAALLVGCGSSQGLLTSRDHDQLTATLLAVRQAVAKGNCPDTSDALSQLETAIDGLPPQTNGTLLKNLRQGAGVVKADASRQCHHKRPKPPATTTSSTTSTTTTTTTTTAPTTPTQPTTSSTPAPTTPPQTSATTPPATGTAPSSATTPGPPTTSTSGGSGLTPNSGANAQDSNG